MDFRDNLIEGVTCWAIQIMLKNGMSLIILLIYGEIGYSKSVYGLREN